MGHAAHFLRRLDRLSDPHVELALRLYNDPELLGATLARAKLPESADRVAIALEDPREGPFLVVTREGRFVTSLGRGMTVSSTPIVTRDQLDAAARHVERMRVTIAQTRYFDANRGLLRKKFAALYAAGPDVGREQFEDIARWEPLLGTMCLTACISVTCNLLDHAGALKDVLRPHPRHEARLKAYYELFHACAHLYVLAAMSPPSRELLADIVDEHPEFTWTWGGVRHGIGYLMSRALWSTARMGKPLLAGQKRALRGELTYTGVVNAMLGAAVLGLGHEKLRAEVQKALRAPRRAAAGDPRIEPLGTLLEKSLGMCFDLPDAANAIALEIGQNLAFRQAHNMPAELRWEVETDVPPSVARAYFASLPSLMTVQPDLLIATAWMLPWLASAKPAELYLPSSFIDAIRRPWRMEDTMDLLEMYRNETGVRTPARSDKTVGRNDPCPCGSGRKSKRCCAK